VKSKTVLVIGSQSPWLESVLLAKGAAHITTFDYVQIKCAYPQIETITPGVRLRPLNLAIFLHYLEKILAIF
jgi:hypothetical protein